MRYPKDLENGGCIGFLAPSFGCAFEPYKSAFDNGLKRLNTMGHSVELGPNCYAMEGVGISNTPKKCGEEVNASFLSEKSDVLISCGGGELMCEILEYVDFDGIAKAEPKWYMGYSDNTNMTYLLTTLCDTASIYGPCAATFGMEPLHPAIEDAYKLLRGEKRMMTGYDKWEKESLKNEENPLATINATEERILKTYVDGVFTEDARESSQEITLEGRLLGGCMDCLVNLLGTRFDKTTEFIEKYREDGIVWFLEACDLNTFSIRRAMWQMEQAGWFKYTKGFLFGRALNDEPMFGLDAYQAVLPIASKYNVPVIFDLDIGHKSPMMPLVCGSVARVRVVGNDVEIGMEYR